MTQQLIWSYRKFRNLGYSPQDAHRMAKGKLHMFREGIFAAAYFNGEGDDFPITLCLVQESANSGEHGTTSQRGRLRLLLGQQHQQAGR